MRRAVQNRAAEAVWVFDAGGAVLRGQSRSTTATGKSNAKGKRLERAWRMHTLLCTPEFSGVDGREPPLWHVSNVTALGKGLCKTSFSLPVQAPVPGMSIRATTDKQNYLAGEPVFVVPTIER